MNEQISSILKSVSKPGRYSAGEYGQTIKDKSQVKARFAFCFPDSYEIGMSNLGVRILYGSLNDQPDIWCERAYMPWVDMEEKMREHNLPLCAHESGDPLKDFDIVAFTLQYEMCYTNAGYARSGRDPVACLRPYRRYAHHHRRWPLLL